MSRPHLVSMTAREWVRRNPVLTSVYAGVAVAFIVAIELPVIEGPRAATAVAASAEREAHADMIYADGTRYVWNGERYRNAADPPEQKPEKRVRPYHTAFTESGASYRLFDQCDIPHDKIHYARVPMSIVQLRRLMECDGEVISETRMSGINQKIIIFRGRDLQDTFLVTTDRNRVVSIDRNAN